MDEMLNKGKALLAEGRIDEAEECFLAAAGDDNAGREAYNNLGVIACRKRDGERAADCFLKGITSESGTSGSLTEFYDLLQETGALAQTGELLRDLATRLPENREIPKLLSRAEHVSEPVEENLTDTNDAEPGLPADANSLFDRLRRGTTGPPRNRVSVSRDNTRKVKIRRPPENTAGLTETTNRTNGRLGDEQPVSPPADLIKGWELFTEGKVDEAETCFLRVLDLDYENKEAHNNLGVVAFRRGELARAEEHFSLALLIDPTYHDATSNLAAVRNRVRVGATEESPPVAGDRRLREARLAIVNPFDNKFNDLYSAYFSRNNEVRLMKPEDEEELRAVADWADIVWTTWCNEPLVYLSNLPRRAALVTHIRSYEVLTPELMSRVSWKSVDGAIFVADHIRDMADSMWGLQLDGVNRLTVPNCVDLTQHPLFRNGPGKNVAWVGNLNHKKGISLLMQCIKEAVDLDPEYKFHFAGEFQETRFEVYVKHLAHEMDISDNIKFYGWVDDIPGFLSEMNYIVSTSPWEACPNSIIEAMACGIKPLIHNWKGAESLFPSGSLFCTVKDFLGSLTAASYEPDAYRRHVEENFSADTNMPRIDTFLASVLENRNESEAGRS